MHYESRLLLRFGDADPYAILGVSREASVAEVKRACECAVAELLKPLRCRRLLPTPICLPVLADRRLSTQYHPDTNKEPGAGERFAELGRAYEILSDEAARQSFDVGAFHNKWEYDEWQRKQGKKGGKGGGKVGGRGFYPDGGAVEAWDSRKKLRAGLKDRSKPILLMFYAHWCVHCQQFAPKYREIALALEDTAVVAAVNCGDDEQVCADEQIPGYPTLRLLLPNPKPSTETWAGPLHSAEEVLDWVKETMTDAVVPLPGKRAFTRAVLNSTDPWLVNFSAGQWCHPCTTVRGMLRKVAARLQGRVKVASVDCETGAAQAWCNAMDVQMFPMLKLFPAGIAAKASFNDGKGQALMIPQHMANFPPGAALDLAMQVLDVLIPPPTTPAGALPDDGAAAGGSSHVDEL